MIYKVEITTRRKEVLYQRSFGIDKKSCFDHFNEIIKVKTPKTIFGNDMNVSDLNTKESIGFVRIVSVDDKKRKTEVEKYRYKNTDVNICYKTNHPCKHKCSGLCKESY